MITQLSSAIWYCKIHRGFEWEVFVEGVDESGGEVEAVLDSGIEDTVPAAIAAVSHAFASVDTTDWTWENEG